MAQLIAQAVIAFDQRCMGNHITFNEIAKRREHLQE